MPQKEGDELLKGLNELEQKYSFISNVRGKGVLCAFSLENNSQRNQMREAIYKSGSLCSIVDLNRFDFVHLSH